VKKHEMIISASYKTDIPTFYGEWFMNRLKAGFCMMVNPYNRRAYRISLKRKDVDGIVFWTKNLGPFVNNLEVIHKLGYPFFIQYAITGYPKALEYSVVDAESSIEHMKMIADNYGAKVGVWRYDTIVFSSLTPIDFHLKNFTRIAKALEGVTDEVIISFAQLYRKTLRNMDKAAQEFGFTWNDPSDDVKIELVLKLSKIAQSFGMMLTICAQPEYVTPEMAPSSCVDAKRLSEIAGKYIKARIKGNRPNCRCCVSKDIGAYDTCPHGCVYCYAVLNRNLAMSRYKSHDPDSPFLFEPKTVYYDKPSQKSLFD
jgi:hypothetical protein